MSDCPGLNDASVDEDLTLKLVELLHLCEELGVVTPLEQAPFAPAGDSRLDGSVVPLKLFLQLKHAGFEPSGEALKELRALLGMEENPELLGLATRFQAGCLKGDEFLAPVGAAELVRSNPICRCIAPTGLLVGSSLLNVQGEDQVLPEEDAIHLALPNKGLNPLLRWTQVHLIERLDHRPCRLCCGRLSLKLVGRQGD